ncbi:MAG: hypothetical protein Q9169_000614 [Polycauliona sp. 2 TL-2023]
MAIRGQRFRVDLDSDEETQAASNGAMPRSPWGLVADIQERSTPTTIKPPSPPKIKNSRDGFPVHKKRFKSGMSKPALDCTTPGDGTMKPSIAETIPPKFGSPSRKKEGLCNRHEIDFENKQRLAGMSSEGIDEIRRELMSSLTPSLIEKLLRKANIEEDQESEVDSKTTTERQRVSQSTLSNKKVNFNLEDAGIASPAPMEDAALDPEDISMKPPADLHPVSTFPEYSTPPPIHFPRPPTPPALDPEDPEFLSKLHSTYFPSLPSNPKALSWMQPPVPGESEAYSPSLDNLLPSAVRFDFRGRLLPPRLASQIAPTKGLHHHGTAPEAAGYTIPELAHLSRSSFPSQRCIAYQTLGRILYRLGTGVFGPEDHVLCQGLWKCIEQGRVLDTLTAEAARDEASGSRTCWVTATEAVWLWRKGGGRKWKAT